MKVYDIQLQGLGRLCMFLRREKPGEGKGIECDETNILEVFKRPIVNEGSSGSCIRNYAISIISFICWRVAFQIVGSLKSETRQAVPNKVG